MKKLRTGLQQTSVQITNELGHLATGTGRCLTRADSYTYAYPNPNANTNSDSTPDHSSADHTATYAATSYA
jgi:hypothetical protein